MVMMASLAFSKPAQHASLLAAAIGLFGGNEHFSMTGLVFLTDFFDWTTDNAIQAFISDIQYTLNTDPGLRRRLSLIRILNEAFPR
jgi:hypothetical protein